MNKRFDCLSPRAGKEGKTYWHRVGTAFESREGGMQVYLDSYPLSDKEGRVSFIIREAKDLREAAGTVQRTRQTPPSSTPIDDDVPF